MSDTLNSRQHASVPSRRPNDTNPLLVEEPHSHRGNPIDLQDEVLRQLLGRLQRDDRRRGRLEIKLRTYRGTSSTENRRFRLVGVRDEDVADTYRLFPTNVTQERLKADQLDNTYRLRWQIALLFDRLETRLRLHELPSTKEDAVQALVRAAVLSFLVSGVLMAAMRRVRPDRVYPPQRVDAVFPDFAELIFWAIAAERRDEPLDRFRLMLREPPDPNRIRDVVEDIPSRAADPEAFADTAYKAKTSASRPAQIAVGMSSPRHIVVYRHPG